MDRVEVRRVGIRFSDNDFGTVVRAFLNLLVDRRVSIPFTRAEVADLFNRAVPGLYWLVQNRLRYRTD